MLSAHRRTRRGQRGFALMDGLVAMGILAFGLLAMTRFQTRMIAMATEARSSMVASQYADELLSSALVDRTNAACYTIPFSGTCANAAAKTNTQAWLARVASAPELKSATATATLTTVGTLQRLAVNLTWTSRDPDAPQRKVEMTTDVTP